jgi:hypothetical protein
MNNFVCPTDLFDPHCGQAQRFERYTARLFDGPSGVVNVRPRGTNESPLLD